MAWPTSPVSVVPNPSSNRAEAGDDDDSSTSRINAQARQYWSTWLFMTTFDTSSDTGLKTDAEVDAHLRASNAGRLLLSWLKFTDRFGVTFFHSEVLFYLIFLLLFTLGELIRCPFLAHHISSANARTPACAAAAVNTQNPLFPDPNDSGRMPLSFLTALEVRNAWQRPAMGINSARSWFDYVERHFLPRAFPQVTSNFRL